MKKYEEKNNVSRETISKLKMYEASLKEWQQKFNLVSHASLEDAWNRHFEDSMQLFDLIPENAKVMFDFGSGAGFPGMVLAVMASEKTPYLKVSLVESIKKKTLYLNEVKHILDLNNVTIINDRIENVKTQIADVITSRAMTSLDSLIGYSIRFCNKKTNCIFPKGKSHLEEIELARKNWSFDLEILKSTQSEEGVILVLTNISKIKGAK